MNKAMKIFCGLLVAVMILCAAGTTANGTLNISGDLLVTGNITGNIAGTQITSGTISNGRYYGTLCTKAVATDESTASTSFTDLSTVQSCTFSLSATTSVIAIYQDNAYLVGGTASITNEMNVDTTGQTSWDSPNDGVAATTGVPTSVAWGGSLNSGSHTIKVQYKTSANTVHHRARVLTVLATP